MHLPFEKDPDATLDYLVNWRKWLYEGDEIISTSFNVPIGLTKESEDHDSLSAWVWLSGGTPGQKYTVTNTIQTAAGRIDERSFTVRIKER